jgi:WD40 repeat protein
LKSEVTALRGQVHALQEEVHRLKTVLHGPTPQRYRIDKKLEGHMGKILALYWLEDELLVSAADDDTVRIWDVTTGQCLQTLDNVSPCLGVMSTGQHILTIDADSLPLEVQLWDARSGRCLRTSSLSGPVVIGDTRRASDNSVLDDLELSGSFKFDECTQIGCHLLIPRREFHPGDDPTPYRPPPVVYSSSQRAIQRLKNIDSLKAASTKAKCAVTKNAFGTIGRTSSARAILHSATSRNLLTTFTDAEVQSSQQLNQDSTEVLDSNEDEFGYLVEDVGAIIGNEVKESQMIEIEDGEYKELDDWLIVGGEDCLLRVMDMSTGNIVRVLEGHFQTISTIALAASIVEEQPSTASNSVLTVKRRFRHLIVLSASTDMTIRVWDVLKGTSLAVLTGHHSSIRCLSILPSEAVPDQEHAVGLEDDNKIEAYVVSGSEGGSLRLWALRRVLKPRILNLSGYDMSNNFFDPSNYSDEEDDSSKEGSNKNANSFDNEGHSHLSKIDKKRYGMCESLASIDNGHVESITSLQPLFFNPRSSSTANMLHAMTKSSISLPSLAPSGTSSNGSASHSTISVISASEDTTLRVWSVRTLTAEYDYEYCLLLQGHRAKVNFVLPITVPPPLSYLSLLSQQEQSIPSGGSISRNITVDSEDNCKRALPDNYSAATKSVSRLVTATSSSFFFHHHDSSTHLHNFPNDTLHQPQHGSLCGPQIILSGADDGTMVVWDTHTGDELHTLHGHIDSVQCALVLDQIEFAGAPNTSQNSENEADGFCADGASVSSLEGLRELPESHRTNDLAMAPHRHHVLVSGGSRGVLYTWTWS